MTDFFYIVLALISLYRVNLTYSIFLILLFFTYKYRKYLRILIIYISLIFLLEISFLAISEVFKIPTRYANLFGIDYYDISEVGILWKNDYIINFFLVMICAFQYSFDRIIPDNLGYIII